jgi:hypothetical protein
VLGLAPDESSARAGRTQASRSRWPETGCDDRAVWGACQGSGKNPYLVAVDLGGPAYQCSCPSRKIPCKHALGLLLMWSAGEVQMAARPERVGEWLASRDERAGRAAARAGREADPEARARRAEQRAANVDAGVAELERWMTDLARGGLAAARGQPWRFWDAAAARLVDAQAPGLASRVRGLGGAAHQSDDWAGGLLDATGRLWLAVRAWQRADGLSEAERADLQAFVGIPVRTEAVLERGERVRSRWAVCGQITEELDERLRVRRTWLYALDGDERWALLVSFAAGGAPFVGDLVAGTVVEGTLAFHPGPVPQRAVVDGELLLEGELEELPAAATVGAALEEHAAALGASPWLDRWPMALAQATPARARDGWALVDGAGAAVALTDPEPWPLVALSGGRPLEVFGEWRRGRLRVLWAAGPDGSVRA